jgi:hypothetical protein
MGFLCRFYELWRKPPSPKGRFWRSWHAAVLVGLGGVATLSASAVAERAQQGNVIVAFAGGITPRTLPRERPAPVAVHLAGRVSTSDHSLLPRINWIRLELAWRGVLDTRGLSVCPRERLAFANDRQAMERCGAARVGTGHLFAQIFLPHQAPFGTRAQLIAFNGRTRSGGPLVLVHAYSHQPPVSFVIPFRVYHKPGTFRTVLVTIIRRSVGPWPHVANFQIRVSRSFMYRGRRHSYLSASCPIPKHFTAGFLSFARATYALSGDRKVTTEAVRSCRAR